MLQWPSEQIWGESPKECLLILRCVRPPQSPSVPNNFGKHQYALMDHNIFMEPIGSIVFVLNQSTIFFEDIYFYFSDFFFSFFMSKNLVLGGFIKKNFLARLVQKLCRCEVMGWKNGEMLSKLCTPTWWTSHSI